MPLRAQVRQGKAVAEDGGRVGAALRVFVQGEARRGEATTTTRVMANWAGDCGLHVRVRKSVAIGAAHPGVHEWRAVGCKWRVNGQGNEWMGDAMCECGSLGAE